MSNDDKKDSIFPVLRRVFPVLITNDLVSIQPMAMPQANIFHIPYGYKQKIKLDDYRSLNQIIAENICNPSWIDVGMRKKSALWIHSLIKIDYKIKYLRKLT